MNNWRNILIGVLTILVVCLGIAYERKSVDLNETRQNLAEMRQSIHTRTIVRTVTKPDGTTISRSDTRADVQTETRTSTKVEKNSLSRYALTVAVGPDLSKESIYMDVGARLGNLPLWLVLGSRPMQRELHLGIRWEF